MNIQKIILVVLATHLLTSCTYMTTGLIVDQHRGAIASENDYFGDRVTEIVYPDQNWDKSDSLWFYNTTQGSNLMSYDIFIHLEQANNTRLFRDNNNMLKYRYLIQKPSLDNEHGLPVGWVKNNYLFKDYVGFTCAACHTAQLNYQGKGIRIDGGPAMADMEMLLIDLEAALLANLSDSKFSRLAKKILDQDFTDKTKQSTLRKRLTADFTNIKTYNAMNKPSHIINGQKTEVHYGYARLDAFGRIYNRVMSHLVAIEDFKTNPANAPVSYPFLWDTPRQDYVQWNGVGNNAGAFGLGPLGRNTGEVLGVFASFEVNEGAPGDYSIPSSADSLNQVRLETHLNDLWSPSWQELTSRGILPKIDQALAAQGKQVYQQYKCNLCHQVVDRKAETREVMQFASVDLIGTDPMMARNAQNYCGASGVLINASIPLCPNVSTQSDQVNVLGALTRVTTGVLTKGIFRFIWAYLYAIIDNPLGPDYHSERHVDFKVSNQAILDVYKGRPLNGIWATAPYLHNGSVVNLYELFLPSCSNKQILRGKKCRSNRFTVGNREFDTKHVGFVQNDLTGASGKNLFVFDTSLPSNSNRGHEYAVGVTAIPKLDDNGKVSYKRNGDIILERFPVISPAKRLALVEYLKTL